MILVKILVCKNYIYKHKHVKTMKNQISEGIIKGDNNMTKKDTGSLPVKLF